MISLSNDFLLHLAPSLPLPPPPLPPLVHSYLQVMVNSRELSFHNEIQFRNSLVEYLTQWVSGELCIADQCTHEDNLRR